MINRKARSTDPKQQSLRDLKKQWQKEMKVFIAQNIALKRGISGVGDERAGLPSSNIKDPLPNEVSIYIEEMVTRFNNLVNVAKQIVQEQDLYSKTRKKSKKEASNNIKDFIIIKNNKIPTLLALTEEEKNKGLMYKAWPPPIMSFPFITAKPRKFWMKNTPSPLDIIFCKANKIVQIDSGIPYCLNHIGPNSPIDLVVEMPAGTAKSFNIKAGDNIKLKYSISSLAKEFSMKS